MGDAFLFGLVIAGLGLLSAALLLATRVLEFRTARIQAHEVPSDHEEVIGSDAIELSRPESLPARFKGFVNRTQELRLAEERVYEDGEAILVFEGEKGIGKSVAAVELAHRLRQGEPRGNRDLRNHEYIWVMGGSDRGGITLADIGRALNVATEDQSVSAVSPAAKLDRLRRHLASRKTALVLDSLKLSNDGESDGMREFLSLLPEGSLIIAAADNRGDGLDAVHVELTEFDVGDVEDLVAKLVERLNLKPVELFDRAFAERLSDIVGGDPRTITWFMHAYKRSGETLDQRLKALRSGVDLEPLFAPIWRSLAPESRAILSACDCLGGKARTKQLAAACEISEESALRTAGTLYDEGLLSITHSGGDPAFVCSQALVLYIAGETSLDSRYRCLRAMADHYVSVMRADPENARAMLPEVDALREVFDGLNRYSHDRFEDQRVETALQELFMATAGALLTLGFWDDRLAAAEYAYESSMRTGNYRLASLAGEVLASTYALQGEFEAANSALRHGEIAAEASDDEAEAARQMYSAAFLRYRERVPTEALALIDGAEERALAGNDHEAVVDILDMRAAAHLYLGEIDACEAVAQRSLAICEEIRWERAKSFPLRFLAEVNIHRGDSKAAHRFLKRAQGLATAYDDRRQLARLSLTDARRNLFDRELGQAEEAAARAVGEAQRLGLSAEEVEALALADAVRLARRSETTLEDLVSRRPIRFTDAPVGGD